MDVLLTNTVAVVLVFVLITHLSYSWLLPKPIPGIPHNPVTSVLGDLPAFSHDKKNGNKLLSNFVADMIKIHGSISQILFGWHRIVIVADRNEAERITLGGKMADTTELFRSIIATALPKSQLSLPADDIWKKHRRLAGPSMSRHYLERMSGRIAFGANELVRFWNAKYALVGGTAFEADMDFHMATMVRYSLRWYFKCLPHAYPKPEIPILPGRIALVSECYSLHLVSCLTIWCQVNIALGESIGCIESAYSALPSTYSRSTSIAHLPHSEPPPLFTAGKVIAKAIEKALQSPFPRLSTWIFTYTSPTWWKNYNFMVSFFTSAILRAREREVELGRTDQGLSTNADCVLDMILQREKREGAESLGDQDILDELITYVFAGQDTTAAVLSWLVKYLPANPEIQRKLHEEMSTVFGQDSESNEMLDFNLLDDPERVPVLEAVVAETLRCAAVAAFIGRELLKDEIILGRLVPQGKSLGHIYFSPPKQ
ncbi:unnamed protein product [Rhizoctonia solani]|uniref:Uncharacterized protein n=1 Tax=Rhizoctonia solani TaxID=456999 RepID=A0A8H3BIW4_9AGAM|nr:unnamed protein product [Rhizoctonia solani]CAE6458121.1 unnamed protein product [Rhizoctonia solani]